MKCNFCNYESETEFAFCPQCGKAADDAPAESVAELNFQQEPKSSFAQKAAEIIRNKLFLGICICVTASAAAGILAGSIPLITILAAIFCFLIYSDAAKEEFTHERIRNLSGTVYAQYIITNVLVGLMAVSGVLIVPLSAFVTTEIASELTSEIGGIAASILALSPLLLGPFIIAMAGIIFAVNFFLVRPIHRYIKSVYMSVQGDLYQIEFGKRVPVCLIVYAVISAVSALSGGKALSIISNLCLSAAMILAYMLIKENDEIK